MRDHDELDLFAQQLRADLHQAADDVTPAPDGWARVQRRIRRRRTTWQAGGLALAGAGVAAIAVVAIGSPPTEVIELAPGVVSSEDPAIEIPLATMTAQPQPSVPAPGIPDGPAPSASGIVYSDGWSIHVADIEGSMLWTPAFGGDQTSTITDLTVRPGGTLERFTMAYRTDATGDDVACGDLAWTIVQGPDNNTAGGGVPGVDTFSTGECLGAPVFTDDGQALAWLAELPDGNVEVQHLPWDDDGPAAEQPIRTPIDLAGEDPVLLAWNNVPGVRDDAAPQTMHIRMVAPDGEAYVEAIPVLRAADGTLTPEPPAAAIGMSARGIPRVLDTDEGWVLGRPEAPYQEGVADDRELVWAMTTLSSDGGFASYSGLSWDEGEPLYLDAIGNTAVMGAGEGMVLATRQMGQSVGRTDLPVATTAALLGPAEPTDLPSPTPDPTAQPTLDPTPSPAPAATPSATDSPAPTEPTPEVTELAGDTPPPVVMDRASAIRAAAEAGDWDALASQIPADGFTSSFGGDGTEAPADHIAHYQQVEAEGTDILGILADLLAGPAARQPDADLWVWPPEFLDDGYLGWRLGITPDGTWRFLVAGD